MVDRIRWDTVSYLPFYYVRTAVQLEGVDAFVAHGAKTSDLLLYDPLEQESHYYGLGLPFPGFLPADWG